MREGPVQPPSNSELRIEGWRLDPMTGELSDGRSAVRLEPKVTAVLLALAERAGEVVAKDRLLDIVWPDTYVTEDALWRCIAQLRRIFGDDSRHPRFIETLPRRGYRLIAPVDRPARQRRRTRSTAGDGHEGPPTATSAELRRARHPALPAATVAMVSLLAGLAIGGDRGTPSATPSRPSVAASSERPPASVDELTRRATAYYERGDPADLDKAIDLLTTAAELDPSSARVYGTLASAYAMKFGWRPGQRRWIERAQEAACRALELSPASAEAHKSMGIILHMQGLLHQALSEYRQALALRPGYAAATNDIAVIYAFTGHLAEAVAWRSRLRPGTAERRAAHLTALARLHYLLGDLPRARRELAAAWNLEPFDPTTSELWIHLHLSEGELQEARKLARRSLEVHPASSLLLATAGQVELAAGSLEAARLFYEASMATGTGEADPTSRLGLAYVLFRSGEGPRGRALLDGLLARVRDSLSAGSEEWADPLNLARAEAILGRPKAALAALEEACERGYSDSRWLRVDPLLAELASDARFEALLRRIDDRVAGEVGLLRQAPSDGRPLVVPPDRRRRNGAGPPPRSSSPP